ncbi:hypothetical protein PS720_06467 [Pseudomonas fluorescens]|nr:hypothetical protein PS720_06467 [Pseudomonas fluorescens]
MYGDHVQVGNQAGLVLVLGQAQRLACGLQRFVADHRLVFQHLELHHVVFHFAETIQYGLAVFGHGLVIGGHGTVDFRRALATVEQGHGQLRPYRPEAVRQADPVSVGAAGVTTGQAQAQVRVVGGLGHTYIGVGGDHRAFGRGNVRAALQQLRGQAHWNLRQRRDVFAHRQVEVGRRLADQHGNRVFQLGTLPDQVDQAGLGGLQLGLRLGHRLLAGHTGAVLVFGHLQGALVGLQGGLQQTCLFIHDAQLQVALHQFRLLAQAHCRQVCRAGFGAGLVGFQATAQLAPDVRLPAHAQLRVEGVTDAAA